MSHGNDYSDKLSFLAEWFDYKSAYQKRFLLNFFPMDSTLELYDRELNRIFLKRTHYDGLEARDVFVGNSILLYGRQIKITDYADCRTRNLMGKAREHTFCLIKPTLMDKLGEIFNQIQDRQFEIIQIRMCKLSQTECLELYESRKGSAYLPFTLDHVTSGPVVALELVGDDAIERFQKHLGHYDPFVARKNDPNSLRAIYGIESASNGFHCSHSPQLAATETSIFFPKGNRKAPKSTVRLQNSTCCVIKPHALHEGKLGYIIEAITESKFRITSMQTIYLNSANADEFLEVYKGVVVDYHALYMSFLGGPCVALEISGKTHDQEDVHGEFRKFAGPADSEVARQIRPYTLRARFGVDKYKNAVHCTDLKDDTNLELDYFFRILS